MRRRLNKSKAFSLLLLISCPLWARLTKTYPTSPVTTLRLEAYQDAFETIWFSTYTVNVSTDITPAPCPNGESGIVPNFFGSTFTVCGSEKALTNFINDITEWNKIQAINAVADDGIEEYMVWPDTSPPKDWGGWCLQGIPVACP